MIVNYRARADAAAQRRVIEIAEQGGEARAVQADVGQLSEHVKLIEAALTAWGRIDVLVNNAGITSPGRKDVLEATAGRLGHGAGDQSEGPVLSGAAGRATA